MSCQVLVKLGHFPIFVPPVASGAVSHLKWVADFSGAVGKNISASWSQIYVHLLRCINQLLTGGAHLVMALQVANAKTSMIIRLTLCLYPWKWCLIPYPFIFGVGLSLLHTAAYLEGLGLWYPGAGLVREASRDWSLELDQALCWSVNSTRGLTCFWGTGPMMSEESKNLSQSAECIPCRCSSLRLAIACSEYTPHMATIMKKWPWQEAPTIEKTDPC